VEAWRLQFSEWLAKLQEINPGRGRMSEGRYRLIGSTASPNRLYGLQEGSVFIALSAASRVG